MDPGCGRCVVRGMKQIERAAFCCIYRQFRNAVSVKFQQSAGFPADITQLERNASYGLPAALCHSMAAKDFRHFFPASFARCASGKIHGNRVEGFHGERKCQIGFSDLSRTGGKHETHGERGDGPAPVILNLEREIAAENDFPSIHREDQLFDMIDRRGMSDHCRFAVDLQRASLKLRCRKFKAPGNCLAGNAIPVAEFHGICGGGGIFFFHPLLKGEAFRARNFEYAFVLIDFFRRDRVTGFRKNIAGVLFGLLPVFVEDDDAAGKSANR